MLLGWSVSHMNPRRGKQEVSAKIGARGASHRCCGGWSRRRLASPAAPNGTPRLSPALGRSPGAQLETLSYPSRACHDPRRVWPPARSLTGRTHRADDVSLKPFLRPRTALREDGFSFPGLCLMCLILLGLLQAPEAACAAFSSGMCERPALQRERAARRCPRNENVDGRLRPPRPCHRDRAARSRGPRRFRCSSRRRRHG